MSKKKLNWIKRLWLRILGRRFISYQIGMPGNKHTVIQEAYWDFDDIITITKQVWL